MVPARVSLENSLEHHKKTNPEQIFGGLPENMSETFSIEVPKETPGCIS